MLDNVIEARASGDRRAALENFEAVRRESEIGSRIGALYAANTVGAVAGTVLAGFVLLPGLGLRRTIWVAVGANLLVFAAAAFLSRATAGVVGGKFVAVLPGSPAACRLAVERLILPELGHVAELLGAAS